jgi:D-glycero-D-manno-heptose 1,7-bisphosphate phosphatase
MLLRAQREFGVSLADSLMVGDRCSDIAAANRAGVRQAFLIAGTEEAGCPGNYLKVNELLEIEDWLEQNS